MRPGELRYTRWDEVDVDKAVIRIPGERMKMQRDHIVPLSSQALVLLEQCRNVTGNNELYAVKYSDTPQ